MIPRDLASNVKKLHDFLYGSLDYQVTESVQSISDEIVYRSGVEAKKEEGDSTGEEGSAEGGNTEGEGEYSETEDDQWSNEADDQYSAE